MKLIYKIFGNFCSIKPVTMLVTVPLTLAYPVTKALILSKNGWTVFSDALLIISLIMIAAGVLFTFARFGDFDISSYLFRRGTEKNVKPFQEYKKDRREERANSFNYPLFFGLVYFAVSMLIGLLCA